MQSTRAAAEILDYRITWVKKTQFCHFHHFTQKTKLIHCLLVLCSFKQRCKAIADEANTKKEKRNEISRHWG